MSNSDWVWVGIAGLLAYVVFRKRPIIGGMDSVIGSNPPVYSPDAVN